MSKVKGGDAFHRMNYLYQVLNHVLENAPSSNNLHCYYGHTMRMISRRIQAKLHPSIKRTLCKKCSMLLSPGVTCTVRLRGKRSKHQVIRCLTCGTIKRFKTKKGYSLWYDQPEAQQNFGAQKKVAKQQ
ncbi:ribonuclease P protein subunit p21-like [Ornithodoros turicata]|uniref:Putative der and-141 ribonuclease p 21 subunit n=1 Tax=Ornithodoros turicata TaxID=34597 RepID=A0A2R5L4A0_9ACAR